MSRSFFYVKFLFWLIVFGAAGCDMLHQVDPLTKKKPEYWLNLKPITFENLPGWNGDNHAEALSVFLQSCRAIKKKEPNKFFGTHAFMGKIGEWSDICEAATRVRPGNNVDAKYFFEKRFSAFLVLNDQTDTGLFTGYYEPVLKGSWSPDERYKIPLFSLPKDLVTVDLGGFKKKWAGQKIIGKLEEEKLKPYYDRQAIENGALSGRGLEILWVDSQIDAFFLHIQGSGRILLSDGSHIRVGYSGSNGHAYTSIGRILVGMGEMKLRDVNLPNLKVWLRSNPISGQAVMQRNRSFIFFRVIQEDSPIGAQNIPLTPMRSMAVDQSFIPLGVPIWLDTQDPLDSEKKLRRLFVAQDTGSAIKGPIRGDIFWGKGDRAEKAAGIMRTKGRYFLLLPINGRAEVL